MNDKIEKLEELLDVEHVDKNELLENSKNLVSEIDDTIKEVEKIDVQSEDLINFENLKKDYYIVRENLLKLINLGQRFLETVNHLDIYELKAGQVSAISEVYNSITNSLKMLIDIYKQIAEIDLKYKKSNEAEVETKKTEIKNQQNIIFTGTSSELLRLLDDYKKQSS